MRKHSWIVFSLALLVAVFFIGCEGEEGPQGPAGPEGPQGPQGPAGPPGTGPDWTYIGGGDDCNHCHADGVDQWMDTGHASAYAGLPESMTSNNYCLQCHTTGFDATLDEDGNIVDNGDDMYGYDDYVGVEGDTAAMRREALGNVGCEACHGAMGPDFNEHQTELSFATRRYVNDDGENVRTASCDPCHHTQVEEWGGYTDGQDDFTMDPDSASGHALAAGGDIEALQDEHYAHRSYCDICHVSEGFVRDNDPAFADYDFGHDVSFIGCVTCHDPHSNANTAQLRDVGDVSTPYSIFDPETTPPTMSGYGTAQTCAQCHHSRRDNEHVQGQIESGYAHFGPHSSPQMDMFIGYGSYEIDGMTYEGRYDGNGTTHQSIADACVTCHMVAEANLHGEPEEHSYHTFKPTIGNCDGCHGSATEADFPDFNGGQTDIENLMNQLAPMLSTANYTFTTWEEFEADAADWSQDSETTTVLREAGYALQFVISDGSKGLHNPAYAEDLLQNAIDYLSVQ